jgi:hypothetical protein
VRRIQISRRKSTSSRRARPLKVAPTFQFAPADHTVFPSNSCLKGPTICLWGEEGKTAGEGELALGKIKDSKQNVPY